MMKNIPTLNKETTRFYIAGAITGTDDYAERFQEAEDFLTGLGYKVVNPVKVTQHLPPDTTWRQYMYVTRACLEICNAIYLLDGWHKSKGAYEEYIIAKNRVFKPAEIVLQSGTFEDLYDKRFPIGSRWVLGKGEDKMRVEIIKPHDFNTVNARGIDGDDIYYSVEQSPEWFLENAIPETK